MSMDDRIDLEALHYYLSYKYVPSPHTIYRGKKKQPLFDASVLRFSPAHQLTEDELVDRLDELLRSAVSRVLPDPPALFLSGGIDSALIAAIASRVSDKPLRTLFSRPRSRPKRNAKTSNMPGR
jgi:asparagine synthase (glutamine-hydrolysing)